MNYKHPQFNIDTIDMSIADFIAGLETDTIGNVTIDYANTKIFTNPTKTTYDEPCFYILYINPVSTKTEVSNTALSDLFIEIRFEYPYDDDMLYDIYKKVAQKIDENIKQKLTYNIRDENYEIIEKIPLYTFDRSMKWNTNAMEYQFHMRLRIIESKEHSQDKINDIKWNVNVKAGAKNGN